MRFWYRPGHSWQAWLLSPLSLLIALVVRRRFRQRHAGQYGPPVLVVGNLAVGGTGKSPAIQALVQYLQAQGLRCGLVSRGYGGQASSYPWVVGRDDDASVCGDEPLMLARTLDCPVVVDPNRDQAVKHLMARFRPDVVISDDGLQHYRLGRNLELVMIDGHRGLGNGRLLPAGPLREPISRLASVDWTVARDRRPDGIQVDAVLSLNPLPPTNTLGEVLPPGVAVDACAGIGNPDVFFQQLEQQGYQVQRRWTPGDHRPLPAAALQQPDRPLLITEKDAVKLPNPLPSHCYVVRLQPRLPDEFLQRVESALRTLMP